MKIQFERSRSSEHVPPGCPVWRPVGALPIPLVRMETQHIKSTMKMILRNGHRELRTCKFWLTVAKEGRHGWARQKGESNLSLSVESLKRMDMWYTRFTEELKRRKCNGEDVDTYPFGVSAEGATSRTWRDRAARLTNGVRHLLSASKGVA